MKNADATAPSRDDGVGVVSKNQYFLISLSDESNENGLYTSFWKAMVSQLILNTFRYSKWLVAKNIFNDTWCW